MIVKDMLKNLKDLLPNITNLKSVEKFYDDYENYIVKSSIIAFEYDISVPDIKVEPDIFLFLRDVSEIKLNDKCGRKIRKIISQFTIKDREELEGAFLEFDGPNHETPHGFFMRLDDTNIKNKYKQDTFLNKFLKGLNMNKSNVKFIKETLTDKIKTKTQWFGQFVGREDDNTLRLAILEPNINAVIKLLNELGWKGNTKELKLVFGSANFKTKFYFDILQISIDSDLHSRIGIEIHPQYNRGTWNELFKYLFDNKFMHKDQYRIHKNNKNGQRLINHIKLSFDEDGFINSKIYYGGRIQ